MMKAFLSNIYPVKEDILDVYLSHWKTYNLSKRTIITAPGETERYMYSVLEGI